MSTPAVLIATSKIRPGHEDDFAAWQVRHNEAIAKFPGFISSDLMPPTKEGDNEWTFVLNFQSAEELTHWQKSEERATLVGEMMPLVEGGSLGEVMEKEGNGAATGTNVTQVIFSSIKPGMEGQYRAWVVKVQRAQAKYPGYRGNYLQPPAAPGGHWTTLLRYDSQEHLDAWLAAPERAQLLEEAKVFIEQEEHLRLATSFPGWIPIQPVNGVTPPDWKIALLVLLGLFPTVMLELRFLSPILRQFDLNSSFATFIGNVGSVSATSFITMPLFVRWFGWWLFMTKDSPAGTTAKGVGILIALFAAEIGVLWRLL